ncbi:MAG: glycosyltransferase family 39 protein [Chloroflexi bacterium]|nr:glycosyltransferase family 39 protein [Chloroflexota bacterium]
MAAAPPQVARPRPKLLPVRRSEWRYLLDLLLLTGLGLALRLAGLERKSVWFDEAVSAGLAALDLPALLAATTGEANPPLYYLLLHYWLLLGQGDGWLRLPSVVFGTATVAVAALLGRTLFGWRAGLLAGLFTALAPFQVDLSQEARAYALLSLLATTSLLLLVQALARGGWRWAGYALATALALYTHYYAVFLVLAEALYLGLALALRRRWQWSPWAALGLAGLLFLPWLPAFLVQFTTLKGSYWIEPPYPGVLWDTYRAFISYSPPDHGLGTDPLLRVARWLILGLLALALASAPWSPSVLLPALAVAGPVAAALLVSWWLAPLYLIRYLCFAVPAFWVVAARGLDRVPMGILRWPLVGLVVASVAANLPALYGDPYYGRSDLRAAAEVVRARAAPGDLVVHTRPFSETPFAYYNRGQLEEVLLPEGDAAALGDAVRGRPRFWYVRDYGLLDPAEATSAEAEARRYLANRAVLQHRQVQGVQIFLVQGGG